MGTTRYRLIGIGVSNLEDVEGNDFADLIDRRAAEAEHAVDRLRSKFGRNAVVKGLALDEEPVRPYGQGFAAFSSSEVISPLIVKSV